jgi:rRNA processing protein Krr1/Pno1
VGVVRNSGTHTSTKRNLMEELQVVDYVRAAHYADKLAQKIAKAEFDNINAVNACKEINDAFNIFMDTKMTEFVNLLKDDTDESRTRRKEIAGEVGAAKGQIEKMMPEYYDAFLESLKEWEKEHEIKN